MGKSKVERSEFSGKPGILAPGTKRECNPVYLTSLEMHTVGHCGVQEAIPYQARELDAEVPLCAGSTRSAMSRRPGDRESNGSQRIKTTKWLRAWQTDWPGNSQLDFLSQSHVRDQQHLPKVPDGRANLPRPGILPMAVPHPP